jgi:hypothetical protein
LRAKCSDNKQSSGSPSTSCALSTPIRARALTCSLNQPIQVTAHLENSTWVVTFVSTALCTRTQLQYGLILYIVPLDMVVRPIHLPRVRAVIDGAYMRVHFVGSGGVQRNWISLRLRGLTPRMQQLASGDDAAIQLCRQRML